MNDVFKEFDRRAKEVAESDIREMKTIARANHWEPDLFIERVTHYINKFKREIESS